MPALQVLMQRLRQRQRPHGVDGERIRPALEIHVAGALLLWAVSAGIVDEDVDRFAGELLAECGAGFEVRDIQRVNFDLAVLVHKFLPIVRLVRLTYAGDDLCAAARVLLHEFEADAAIGAGDKDGAHSDAPKPPPPGVAMTI